MNVKILRIFRKIHRTTGALLFIFFFAVSITALLLGWKKNSGGLILPKTSIGSTTDLNKWLTIDSLHKIAIKILHDSIDKNLSPELDRIDIRNNKGVVKFVFVDDYWEIQLDGANGKALQILKRRSDLIEDLHDGSFLDYYFKTDGEPFKLFYTSLMGLALFTFTVTGFWLWYGPKKIRNQKKK
jgi:hypothetical protein